MLRRINLKVVWKNRKQIWQGLKNLIIRTNEVEIVFGKRSLVCSGCDLFDKTGEGCMVPGTQPCCNERKGGCGCSLKLKLRSLSSNCPLDKWKAVMSEEEETKLKTKLNYHEHN